MAQGVGSSWLRAGMNVKVNDVSVTVPLSRTLLQHVSLSVQAGEMVALMGPSGAGKTTLLNCLVGRCAGTIEGDISYNGKPFKEMRNSVGYVTQEDTMYETLTPRENLTFAAGLILSQLGAEERQSAVEEVIIKLNLQKCADTVVGSPGLVRGISGGERKRTNVALSLLGRPSLLLLDEPTSGLDSKMSDSLVRDLKEVALEGCTVITTIHQPSEVVFNRFDKVLLLLTGQLAYYGPIAGLRASLHDLGFQCPDGVPVPELLLDALEKPDSTEEQQQHRTRLHQLRQLTQRDAAESRTTAISANEGSLKPSRAGAGQQLKVLLQRELVNLRRSKVLTIVRAVQSIGASALVGLIFLQLERNMSGIQTRLFSSFLLVFTQFMFAMLGVVNAFPAERAVFLRESQDGLYHPAAFYLAKAVLDTVMQCLFPILVVAISYPMVGLNAESMDRVLLFYAIICIVSNCGSAVGFMVSAAVPTVSLALSIAPGLVMPQMLLSGIFIKVDELPQPFNALSYLMVARYAVQATVTNEFTCEEKSTCDRLVWQQQSGDSCDTSPCDFCCTGHEVQGAGGICPVLTCADAHTFLGMNEAWPLGNDNHETILYNIMASLALLLFFRLQGLNILLMSHRRATVGRYLPCNCVPQGKGVKKDTE